jgi:hypothetical protein
MAKNNSSSKKTCRLNKLLLLNPERFRSKNPNLLRDISNSANKTAFIISEMETITTIGVKTINLTIIRVKMIALTIIGGTITTMTGVSLLGITLKKATTNAINIHLNRGSSTAGLRVTKSQDPNLDTMIGKREILRSSTNTKMSTLIMMSAGKTTIVNRSHINLVGATTLITLTTDTTVRDPDTEQ